MGDRQEYHRRYYLANREKLKAKSRENREQNIDRERTRYRRRRQEGYKTPQVLLRDEIKDKFWADQGGCCYLCEEPLASKEAAHLDHDHRCCPHHYVCRRCARGLSCGSCNLLIGCAGDDPDRIEIVARNLRVKLAEIDDRLAFGLEQERLF